MKKMFLNQAGHIVKAHEKVAERSFSSMYDESMYAGDPAAPATEQLGVGNLGMNSLKIRIVSHASISASGESVALFGATDNAYTSGFNISTGFTVTSTPNTYAYLLRSTLAKPFVIKGMKIIVGGSTPASQLAQDFSVSEKTTGGATKSTPYAPADFLSSMQNQAGIVEIPHFVQTISGDTTINYTMLPSQTVDLIFFIASQVDPSRVAEGKHSLSVSNRSFPNTNVQKLQLLQ